MKLSRLLAAAAMAVALPSLVHAQAAAPAAASTPAAQASAPDAQASPAQATLKPVKLSLEEQKAFLKSAKVIAAKSTAKGVTQPARMTLTDGTLTHDAAFQIVDERKAVANMGGRAEINFRDYWGYNIAAHELACLIGRCDLVPAAIERNIQGDLGALVWWVDNVKMDEFDRVKKQVNPPNQWLWTREIATMRLFTHLTADTDRNQTNILITGDWHVVLIDFSRAFRLNTKPDPKALEKLTSIERDVFDGIKGLKRDDLKARASRWLTDEEIDAVMARRDALVTYFEGLVAQKGPNAVFYPARKTAPSNP